MSATPSIEQLIPDLVAKIAYQVFQDSKSAFGVTHKNISDRLTNFFVPQRQKTKSLSPELFTTLRQRRTQLLEADWEDAQAGVYPVSLLFENSWEDFFRYYPVVWADKPNVWQKLRHREYQQFASEIDALDYPAYYLQNFHYQTDGYLSDLSANLYDLQVDILFNGGADAMRRRILKPLKAGIAHFRDILPQQIRVLDVACGTGRTLKMIRATLLKASLFGVDLSPAYLRKANQILSEISGELPQLVRANAEELPYQDDYFHGVTSVFLVHELPPQARQNVINELFRVTKPGGICVICDSMQLEDAPEFEAMMDNFLILFHEPYFKHYTTDNLMERLEKAGFIEIKTENHMVSKYWIACKPA